MKTKKLDNTLEKKLSEVVLNLIKDKEQLNKVQKSYKKYIKFLTKNGLAYPSDSGELFSKVSDTFKQYKNNYTSKNEVPTISENGLIGGVRYE